MSDKEMLRVARNYFNRDFPILADKVNGYFSNDKSQVIVKMEDNRNYIYNPEVGSLTVYFE